MKIKIIALAVTLAVTGCATPGANNRANVYTANQVNQTQLARTIKIISIMPAQVEVSNAENKKRAQFGGAVLGAIAGGLGGGFGHIGALGTAGTTVAGGAVGAAAGSMVADTVLVDGVTIAYSENGQMYTSTQVGRACEFALGTAAVVSTGINETRIQPNANACPPEN